jgi:hypothetical protein
MEEGTKRLHFWKAEQNPRITETASVSSAEIVEAEKSIAAIFAEMLETDKQPRKKI